MVTLKDSDAATILRILEDIMPYDTRAACSGAGVLLAAHVPNMLPNRQKPYSNFGRPEKVEAQAGRGAHT